jgi:tetratricopeptide (TPR) repeat protein
VALAETRVLLFQESHLFRRELDRPVGVLAFQGQPPLLAAAEVDSNRLFALQDADNQLRSDWQARIGLLSVILTMLAVAIYLFGLSLTLQARIRRWLVGLGVVLVVIGLVSTATLQFFNPSAPPDSAADSYAQGMYALQTFYTKPGNTGLQTADADFTQAIRERPNFAQAYLERSMVRFLMGSPDKTSAVPSITTESALQQQGDDLQKAYDLGLNDKLTLNNLAANRLLLAITQNQSGYYSTALGFLRAAQQLDPNDPTLYFNQGLAYLGQGNMQQAQQAYADAVQHTLYTDVATKTARNDATAEENYVAGALTPLDLMAAHRKDLAGDVTTLKQLVVSGVDRNGQAPSGSKAQVSQMALDVFPGELQWTASIGSFDAGSDSVSTQWYYQDPSNLGWAVIPAISGLQNAQANSGVSYANAYFVIRSYLQATDQCLQPGHYKVELYINGNLVGQATEDGSQPRLQAEVMPDLALDFCHPNGWSQDQNNFLRGFSNGFASADGTTGAYFFRFQNPQDTGVSADIESAGFRDEVLSLAQSDNILPSGAGTPTIDCGTTQDGTNTLPWGPALNADCTRQQAYFLGLSGATEAWYTYNGGIVHVGAGIAADGAVVAALTFGADDAWSMQNEPLPDVVFDSIVSTQ